MAYTAKVMAAQLEYHLKLQRLIKMPWIGLTFMNLKILKFENEIMWKLSLKKHHLFGTEPMMNFWVHPSNRSHLFDNCLKDERAVLRRPPYHRPTQRQAHLRWIWFHGYFRSVKTQCTVMRDLSSLFERISPNCPITQQYKVRSSLLYFTQANGKQFQYTCMISKNE